MVKDCWRLNGNVKSKCQMITDVTENEFKYVSFLFSKQTIFYQCEVTNKPLGYLYINYLADNLSLSVPEKTKACNKCSTLFLWKQMC